MHFILCFLLDGMGFSHFVETAMKNKEYDGVYIRMILLVWTKDLFEAVGTKNKPRSYLFKIEAHVVEMLY